MKKINQFLACLALMAGFIGGSPAQATVVFEHAFGDINLPAWCTSCAGSFRVFDQFTLAADTPIAQIDARLYDDPAGFADVLEYSVWDTTRTIQLFAQSFSGAQLSTTALGGPAFDVSAQITGLNILAGTYMLSIYSASGNAFVGWYENGLRGSSFQTEGGGGTDREMSFRLLSDSSTAVPEPSALALIGFGLLGPVDLSGKRKEGGMKGPVILGSLQHQD